MSTIEVVEVITQYLINFGPLLGDIKKRIYWKLFYISFSSKSAYFLYSLR